MELVAKTIFIIKCALRSRALSSLCGVRSRWYLYESALIHNYLATTSLCFGLNASSLWDCDYERTQTCSAQEQKQTCEVKHVQPNMIVAQNE